MKHVVATHVRTLQTLAGRCVLSDNFWGRLVGLMGRKSFSKGEGLLLVPANQIHTLFMHFTIDAVFLDRKNQVLAAITLKPWRASKLYFKARKVLELPHGTLQSVPISIGDEISFAPVAGEPC
jgi:uncharacterized membrane protein (UPF0127 family)